MYYLSAKTPFSYFRGKLARKSDFLNLCVQCSFKLLDSKLIHTKEHFKPYFQLWTTYRTDFGLFLRQNQIFWAFQSILAQKSNSFKFMCMVQLYNCYTLILIFSKKHFGSNLRVLEPRQQVLGFLIRQNLVFCIF